MGRIRQEIYKLLVVKGELQEDTTTNSFAWIVDFPLVQPNEDKLSGRLLQSAHHPFTAPHPDDIEKLETDPLSVRALHYDLVLNGVEVGGGSIRIHDPQLQRFVMSEVLRLTPAEVRQPFFLSRLEWEKVAKVAKSIS